MGKCRTKHCWQNYVDYHKCINARGEEFPPCRQVRFEVSLRDSDANDSSQFLIAFRSLCPGVWINRWDDQRGTSTRTSSSANNQFVSQ